MTVFKFRNKWTEGTLGIFILTVTSLFCYYFLSAISYKIVALLLLMEVSIMAAIFSLPIVVFLAILSAFIWNFFFIPPLFTFHIQDTEDLLLFIMYFIVAIANGVLYVKIRSLEKKNRDKLEKEKLIKLYNTVLNSLSHEMRTPITTILSSVELVKDEFENQLNHKIKECVMQIETAGLRLNFEVDNLLNMSRLDSGMLQLKVEWCDMQDILNDALRRIQLKETQSVEINIDANFPIVKLDEYLFSQVFINLFGNALKHAGDSVRIQIFIHCDENRLFVEFRDNGSGFDSSDLPFVFNKFKSGIRSKHQGLGLGLSIVKGIIDAHNGAILARNGEYGGAVVQFWIPTEFSPIVVN